jgi:hypothetical protein
LFQNLRAARETELAETFPLHVVCAWLGNSRPVAMKHYLQVTDEYSRKAVQNPVQQSAASARNDLQPAQGDSGEPAICGSLRGVADTCKDADTIMVGATGLEQTAITMQKPQISCRGAAKSAATSVNSGPPDPDLAYLVDSWPCLPPSIKAGIVAMVKAITEGDHSRIMPGS